MENSRLNTEIQFMALGGGQEVGASCYFMRIGASLILLDCGKKITTTGLAAPNFYPLLQPPFLESMNQIHQIFISHSHYDHLGNLTAVASSCTNAAIYATPVTKALARYMLWDLGGRYTRSIPIMRREQEEILTTAAVDRIIPVGYCQPITLPGYRANFYEAGHIPGAAMLHIQAGNRSILYTGDFSSGETALTSGYALPENLHPDIMIVCAVHAKHPEFTHSKGFSEQLQILQTMLLQGKSIHLRTTQLTKGLETLMMINRAMDKGFPKRNVYIDESILSLAEKMESMHIPVLREGNYRALYQMPHGAICIGRRAPFGYFSIPMDFSLHPGFQEMKELILRLNPKTLIIVHASPSYDAAYNLALGEALLEERNSIRVIYAENGVRYDL
jgi:Cft2 family RNA processing exonuclease